MPSDERDAKGYMPYLRPLPPSAPKEEGAPKVRVVFMGTPVFAETLLRGLLDGGYNVVAAYTKPDKPSGRKMETEPSPVKRLATERKIPVEQPSRLDGDAIETLRTYAPDIVIVAAYGKILPKAMLDIPGFGCLNVHTSLLPKLRGASPIQNALINGDTETGVTLMLMDEGLDTGPVIAEKPVTIAFEDTKETLTEKLATTGSTLLSETLPGWIKRTIEPRPQDGSRATFCQLIERTDGRVFWNETAETIWNRYRGLSPWPGIFTFWKQKDVDGAYLRLKLTRISIQKSDPAAKRGIGDVFEVGEKVAVRTGKGLVFIEEVQPEGKKPMRIRDFVNGKPDFLGSRLT